MYPPSALDETSKRADQRAKRRDVNARKEMTPDLQLMAEQERKANTIRYGTYKIRDISRVPFAQTIQENSIILDQAKIRGAKYLTNAEQLLIYRLTHIVGYNSNAILKVEKTENGLSFVHGQFATITDIATYFDTNLSNTSKLIGQLIVKGILYEMIDGQMLKQYGRNVKERALFFNPEIVISGNKNYINLPVCMMVWQADRIEKAGIKLPLKIGLSPDNKWGRLYTRDIWTKVKSKKMTFLTF